MKVETLTFGCRLNAVESDAMRRHAETAGHDDLVIVNTCAVTAEAGRQARKAIRKLRRERPASLIAATGCGVEIETAAYAAMPEIGRLVGNAEKLHAATWSGSGYGPGAVMREMRSQPADIVRMRDHTRTFVPIQNGCDHRCTFCVIPFGRGHSRSTMPDAVVAQVRRTVEHGGREVVLTGVDLTAYGRDLSVEIGLGTLVKRILREVPELARLRLSSIDACEADADLLDAFACEPRLMPHLHLSLQAGDDLVLKRMKRRHTRDDAIAFCAQIRSLRPDTVFGADLIAGFPTETEVQFARTLDLVEACDLTHLHVFPYSPRPGTPAERMPQVEPSTIRDRAARLRTLGAHTLARHLRSEIGQIREVLTERGGKARTRTFTPVRLDGPHEPNTFVTLRIADHDGQQLLAAAHDRRRGH